MKTFSSLDINHWRMSAVFAATAAAKQLRPRRYFDKQFPISHDITGLTINEASRLHGWKNVSFIANIGPGIPVQTDLATLLDLEKKLSARQLGQRLVATFQKLGSRATKTSTLGQSIAKDQGAKTEEAFKLLKSSRD